MGPAVTLPSSILVQSSPTSMENPHPRPAHPHEPSPVFTSQPPHNLSTSTSSQYYGQYAQPGGYVESGFLNGIPKHHLPTPPLGPLPTHAAQHQPYRHGGPKSTAAANSAVSNGSRPLYTVAPPTKVKLQVVKREKKPVEQDDDGKRSAKTSAPAPGPRVKGPLGKKGSAHF
ncbi:hypothetical protein HDU91_004633 [Kappamyces sp. JEL0680]|nr:hypothetical protein HDU91_004633 [Kappamyces sp. JEL0680]